MKRYDLVSSLFWLLLSIFACIGSLRLGIGSLQKPDMGFMPFGVSVLLGIFSLTLFLRTLTKKEGKKAESLFVGKSWGRTLLVLMALLIFAKLMPIVGFLISTFLLMTFLFWIFERPKVWWVLVLSFSTTMISYYVFSIRLNCQLPAGLFGF